MFYGIIWAVVGVYFLYLAFEILFLKKTNRLKSLKNKKFKNEKGFITRYGIILASLGVIILVFGLIVALTNNPILFSFKIGDVNYDIRMNYLMVLIAIVYIVLVWLNEKLSKKDE